MFSRASVRSIFAIGLTAMLFAAGCGDDGDSGSSASTTADESKPKIKVGLVTDIGGLNDRSFNSLANAGIEQAKSELGIDARVITSKSNADSVPNLSRLAQQKYDLVMENTAASLTSQAWSGQMRSMGFSNSVRATVRSIEIVKSRGHDFQMGRHSFRIVDGHGIRDGTVVELGCGSGEKLLLLVDALPFTVSCVPAIPEYGPPAFATGGWLATRTTTVSEAVAPWRHT